jgi:hypothetical protein
MEALINKKEMRNEYMDLSIALSECNREEFYKILPSTLPFLAKYPNEFLTQCLIDDVRVAEYRVNNN